MHRVSGISATWIAVVLCASCGSTASVTSLGVNGDRSLPVGTTVQLTASASLGDRYASDVTSSATWRSSDETIATVSQGLITALRPGTTTVIVVANGVSASVDITVTAATLVRIEVGPAEPASPVGITNQFTATGVFTDNTTHDLTNVVNWNSSDPTVATISNSPGSNGLASTVAPGSATITATDPVSGTSGTTTLTVTEAQLVSIALTPTTPSVPVGLTTQFTATGSYTNGTTQDLTAVVAWESSSPGVASVSNTAGSSGLATASAVGSTTIKATDAASGVSGTATLTVTTAQLVSIAVTPSASSAPLGLPKQFTAMGTYTNGTTQDITAAVTWSSSNPSVASVSNASGSKGLATTVGTGSTTIKATDPTSGISATTAFTVTAAQLVSIAVTPSAPSVPLGVTMKFTATGIYTNATSQDLSATVTWSSSNPSVASVSNASGSKGLATTLSVGSTTVKATDPASGIFGTATLTVTSAQLVSIAVTPSAPSVPLGLTKQLTATGTYTNATTQDLTATVTWTSSSSNIASISNATGSKGLATSAAVGSTTITATDPASSISGATTLTVTAAQLVSIAVSPSAPSVPLGLTKQFTATGTYTNGSTQDLTTAATWSSSNTAVASVSNASGSKGLATALQVGSTTITALDPSTNVSGATTLNVTAAQLVSIAVSPSAPSVPLGLNKQFTATGTYTDGTTQNLTTTVTWSSSDTTVAAISNASGSNGLATTLKVGSTTITATDPVSGISGATTLTVTAAQLTSIAVTAGAASIAVNQTTQFTATGTYTDGSTQDLTTSVTWQSSNTSVASISNATGSNGLATGLAAGSTTISATDPTSNVSGSADLTVTAT